MSTTVTLPVIKVTVLEDRALVERRGEVTLPAGPQRLRVEGLSPLAVDRSLQISLSGGALVGARVSRVWKEQPKEGLREHRTELGRRVESLEQAARLAEGDVLRLEARLNVATAAQQDVLRSISERTGAGKAELDTWRQNLAAVRAEIASTEEALRQARKREARAQRQLEEAQSAFAQGEQPETKLITSAEMELNHPTGGAVTVGVAYLVPCAVWRPAYRATLRPTEGGEAVTLECEAVVWQRTEEDWKDVEMAFSTARPTLGASPPRLVEDRLYLRDKTQHEKQVVEVSIREETIQTTGEGGAQPTQDMPGLDDGGEPLTLKALHRVTLPSDGAPHRVPLFQFTAPATSELVGTPEHSPLVHRVARFENKGASVLLAGPVDLVRTSGYVGRAQLSFAGLGERVKLGFGSEDTLRIARQVDDKLDTNRLTGRRTRTHFVKLFVSNTGNRAEQIAIEERMPVSEVEAVEIELLKDKTKPAPAKVSQDGIVRFEVHASPRSQQELSFTYTVSSSSKVAGL
ncbi:mucoidy inhibitor MuiA family protein [Hyalangium rubrum]|uniref:Mucoidy inhibitor MuiA family protein n=1 Tax=Hyalangium rubrum TaxID=3103134 RepID=A0ABU5GYQ2_9BACT|nr:mucoidy inhibitor MuiA family protein [Hyalangium sp. s54d21]MDY7225672.1 mucoidy inhibitor MuiA family protein [Hyalangium sp. s54d21]